MSEIVTVSEMYSFQMSQYLMQKVKDINTVYPFINIQNPFSPVY